MSEQTYPVNEVFATIQGEGTFTGVAAVFVRLQGCNVGCPWCDTKHTWERLPEHRIDFMALGEKADQPEPTFAVLSCGEVLDAVRLAAAGRAIRHVVLTGGEPAMHDLIPLVMALRAAGYAVQLETSGTHKVPMRLDYWCTLSPKLDMPGGLKVLPTAWLRANEIKLPVGKVADIERFCTAAALWMDTFKDKRIFLQPLSMSEKATALCIEQALLRGWSVSLQTHKFAGLR